MVTTAEQKVIDDEKAAQKSHENTMRKGGYGKTDSPLHVLIGYAKEALDTIGSFDADKWARFDKNAENYKEYKIENDKRVEAEEKQADAFATLAMIVPLISRGYTVAVEDVQAAFSGNRGLLIKFNEAMGLDRKASDHAEVQDLSGTAPHVPLNPKKGT